jgi:hypothetical protein
MSHSQFCRVKAYTETTNQASKAGKAKTKRKSENKAQKGGHTKPHLHHKRPGRGTAAPQEAHKGLHQE